MPDNAAKIAELEATLKAGATQVTVDGQTVFYDLAQVRKQLRQLRATDTTQAQRRPAAARIDLGGGA